MRRSVNATTHLEVRNFFCFQSNRGITGACPTKRSTHISGYYDLQTVRFTNPDLGLRQTQAKFRGRLWCSFERRAAPMRAPAHRSGVMASNSRSAKSLLKRVIPLVVSATLRLKSRVRLLSTAAQLISIVLMVLRALDHLW